MALAAWQAAPVAPQQHGCCTACSAQRRVLQRWLRQPRRGARCSMEVPSDSFGGQSPERKAATALRTLFTFCAVKCASAQPAAPGRAPPPVTHSKRAAGSC